MARLLPSSSDVDPNDESRVVGLEDDAAGELIDALGSETTRAVLAALHEEPGSPAELAARVDTSLQNVQYHLSKLEDAGLIEVGDTVYSEKGREMNVYIPADRALVVVAGGEEETSGLRAALSRLLGGIGVLGIASVVVDRLARQGLSVGVGGAPGGADGGGGAGGDGGAGDGGAAPTAQSDAGAGGAGDSTATPTPTEVKTETVTEGGVDIAEATTTTTGPTEAATTTPTPAQMATAEPTATATPIATEQSTATATPVAETTTPTPRAETPVTVTPTDVTTALETTANAPASGVFEGLWTSPGLLFFLGGSTVLVGGFVWWWVRS